MVFCAEWCWVHWSSLDYYNALRFMCPAKHAGPCKCCCTVWDRPLTPTTEDNIKLISSMKALTKGRETFPEYMKQGAFGNMAYSMVTLIPGT